MTVTGLPGSLLGPRIDYLAFRPAYPPELFAFLASVAPSAISLGIRTGNGQAAVALEAVAELDRALAACGCAEDWSAELAAQWWVGNPDGSARYTGPSRPAPLPTPRAVST